ncbi:MAG: HAMP domain-containing sensor histidine kinase [Candidatus Paceibacterota bacterium]
MSGILLSTRIAFFATILSSISLSVFAYLQSVKILNPDISWTMESAETEDVIMFLTFFFVIAIVSWLSNREIEKSLQKARKSEAELKEERNNLELRVEERTKEIQKLQIEKMAQVYHFAELGRLSSGLFHDMINPIMAISLTIEQIKKTSENNNNLKLIENSVNKVKQANDKMQKLIDSIRKQITQHGTEELFSINKEIIDAIELLNYKAKKGNTEIVFQSEREIKTIGDSVKFNQIITNIISNSIDSFQGKEQLKNNIEIELSEKNNRIRITIKDNGCGIPDEIKDRIFDPFFTTKNTRKGMGIGLFLVKEFIEKSLNGKIDIKSKINKGTSTIIKFSSRKK